MFPRPLTECTCCWVCVFALPLRPSPRAVFSNRTILSPPPAPGKGASGSISWERWATSHLVGHRPRMLRSILQHTGQPPQQSVIWPQMLTEAENSSSRAETPKL